MSPSYSVSIVSLGIAVVAKAPRPRASPVWRTATSPGRMAPPEGRTPGCAYMRPPTHSSVASRPTCTAQSPPSCGRVTPPTIAAPADTSIGASLHGEGAGGMRVTRQSATGRVACVDPPGECADWSADAGGHPGGSCPAVSQESSAPSSAKPVPMTPTANARPVSLTRRLLSSSSASCRFNLSSATCPSASPRAASLPRSPWLFSPWLLPCAD
mmetsp:Transcript_28464/g.73096  ORF Transcript_28464/g.73096 Transcript_28464/m.73096 type:complete len:213 (+) Transcript_28464:1216-1854(+)